ncbi:MAG TPA: GtrA family protein [Paraburkholderia sp.]|jgi:putative flippase GtrA|nr:GtrA family protein [Paraburkholderia sp.]
MSTDTAARRALLAQMFRFGIVGTIGFVLDAVMVELLAPVCGPLYAQLVAFPVVVTAMWYLNRRYTFGASNQPIVREWLSYVLANTLGWVASNGVYVLLVLHCALAYRHPSIAVASGALAGMVFNFVVLRAAVFKDS